MKESFYQTEANKIFKRQDNKICGYHGCKTILTKYNPNNFCFAHNIEAQFKILSEVSSIRSTKRLLRMVCNSV